MGGMRDDDPSDENADDQLEAEIMRADRPFGSDRRGTTPEEALEGEGLDEALARERSDGRTTDEALGIEDDGELDGEGELVGEGSVEEDEFASPEEAALTVRDEAPGATDHDDPHAADEDD